MAKILVILLVITAFMGCVFCQSKVVQSEDGTAGTIKFSTPNLDDDDAHSPWMPDLLKCDACRAVAFSIWRKFTEYNMKRKSFNYDLPESEILDLTEEVCESDKTWESYGMKEVNKQKRLSGPGMDTADTPGVTAGGGKWPSRLRDMCDSYMGELGELSIYKVFFKNPKSRKRFEDFLCRGPGIRSECTEETVEKRKPPKHIQDAERKQLLKEKADFEKERKQEKKKEAAEKKRKDKLRKEKRDAKLKLKEEREKLRKDLGEEQPVEEAKKMEEEKKKKEGVQSKKEDKTETAGEESKGEAKEQTKDELKKDSKLEKDRNLKDTGTSPKEEKKEGETKEQTKDEAKKDSKLEKDKNQKDTGTNQKDDKKEKKVRKETTENKSNKKEEKKDKKKQKKQKKKDEL